MYGRWRQENVISGVICGSLISMCAWSQSICPLNLANGIFSKFLLLFFFLFFLKKQLYLWCFCIFSDSTEVVLRWSTVLIQDGTVVSFLSLFFITPFIQQDNFFSCWNMLLNCFRLDTLMWWENSCSHTTIVVESEKTFQYVSLIPGKSIYAFPHFNAQIYLHDSQASLPCVLTSCSSVLSKSSSS